MQHSPLYKLLDAIETELRKLGYLIDDPGRISGISTGFGYGQVPFEQWPGQVFLPNARAAVAVDKLPRSSQVAVAAVRHFDGIDEADTLLDLLGCFDAKINQMGGTGALFHDA